MPRRLGHAPVISVGDFMDGKHRVAQINDRAYHHVPALSIFELCQQRLKTVQAYDGPE